MFLIIFILIVSAIALFYTKRYRYWTERGVIQYGASPPCGINWETMTGKSSFFEIFHYIHQTYVNARYVGIYDFHKPVLIVKDPELLVQMCIKDFEYFTDHRQSVPTDIDPLWNKNLFMLAGTRWKEMRTTLTPSFTSSKMKAMFFLMEQCADNFVNHFKEQTEVLIEIELKETLSRYTNDVIASTAFGFQCDSLKEKDNEFFARGIETTDLSGLWKNIKFTLLRVYPFLSKIIKAYVFDQEASKFFRNVIQDCVEYREKNYTDRPDLITLLMQARKGTEKADDPQVAEGVNYAATQTYNLGTTKRKVDLSIDDMAAQALIYFFAGFGSTSTVSCFMGYELAVNPDIQRRLIEEIDEYNSKNEKLTYEGIGKMTYLDMVLTETLRKWPPFGRTDRKCTKAYTIQPILPGEKPVHMSVGQTFWIPMFNIQNDSKYWPNPTNFDPERFSFENKHNIVNGSFLPFGIGPRSCIASRFALQEIKILFYKLLTHFEIESIKKSIIPCQIERNSSSVIPANDMWFGLKRRDNTY